MMRHLMAAQIPLILHRFVAFVTTNFSAYCVHVQDVLFEVKLIGKVAVAMDAQLGLAGLPLLARSDGGTQ